MVITMLCGFVVTIQERRLVSHAAGSTSSMRKASHHPVEPVTAKHVDTVRVRGGHGRHRQVPQYSCTPDPAPYSKRGKPQRKR